MIKKTKEEYRAELNAKNPSVILMGEYLSANTCAEHFCLKHGVSWYTTPSRALQGVGCEKCKKERFYESRQMTDKEYRSSLRNTFSNVVALDKYSGMRTPIKHICLLHNKIWETTPDSLLHQHGCPECANEIIGKKNGKAYDVYVKQLKQCNPNIVCIGEYKNSTSPALHKCLVDNHEWRTLPSYILSGRGCPKCHKSVGERQVGQWLDLHGVKYEREKTFDGCNDVKPLPFDFYLPEHNMAIEYDGEQHYRPIEFFGGVEHYNMVTKHDAIKNKYCEENHIALLRIKYDEIVSDKLNSSIYLTQ